MATTATVRTAKFLPLSGGKVRKIMVADSQTIAIDDFVILSSGKVAIAAAAGATASDVYGVSLDKVTASGTGSTTYINVRIIDPTSRFIGNYVNGSSDTSVATAKATTTALPGVVCSLQRVAGKWVLTDKTDTSTPSTTGVAIIEALANEDIVTTAGGRLIFKIRNAITE